MADPHPPERSHTIVALSCGMFSVGLGIGAGDWFAFGLGMTMLLLSLLMAFARSVVSDG